MKHVLLIVPALFLAATSLTAQVSAKLGLGGQTSVIALDSRDISSSAGLGTHFNGTVQFGRRVYLESGLQYFSTSQRVRDVRLGIVPRNRTARLAGMNVPLVAGLRFMDLDGNTNIHVFAGANMRTILTERGGSDFDQGSFRFFNFGALAGLGMSYRFFYGEIAYDFGLTNVFKDTAFSGIDSRQNLLRLTIGAHLFRN